MNRLFHAYGPHRGDITGRRNGVLISTDQGESVAYAMWNLEDRGPMMIEPGWKVYRGMIVGEHTRDNDLEVNVLKGKKLTNIRTHSKDEAIRLTPPIRMTLEKGARLHPGRRAGRGDAEIEFGCAKSCSIPTSARRTNSARKPSACNASRAGVTAPGLMAQTSPTGRSPAATTFNNRGNLHHIARPCRACNSRTDCARSRVFFPTMMARLASFR